MSKLSNVIILHGFPRDVISDRSPLLEATANLSSGLIPKSNDQSEQVSKNWRWVLGFWNHRTWLHGSINCFVWKMSTTSLPVCPLRCLLFKVFMGPLFPDLAEVGVPSALTLVCVIATGNSPARFLLRSYHSSRSLWTTDRWLPLHARGQQVWLSTRDLNLPGVPYNLAPDFIGTFPVSKCKNSLSVRFNLII